MIHPVCAGFNFLLGDKLRGLHLFKKVLKKDFNKDNMINYFKACKYAGKINYM